jgi:hypothetical protein
MLTQPYVIEKLVELESSRIARIRPTDLPAQPSPTKGFTRSLGRTMRLAGERLEAWAGPGSRGGSDYSSEPRYY